jgi:hypothetical protein
VRARHEEIQMINTVCLVGMTSGSHDSYQDVVILVFATKEEGDRAVTALLEELEQLKKVPSAANRFNSTFNALDVRDRTPEARTRLFQEALTAYEEEASAILKVYPAMQKVEGHPDVFSPPSVDPYDGTDFYCQVLPISKLP